jgi:hypothetical protein
MGNPDPIQQKITIDADTSGAKQASDSLQELQKDTREMVSAELESTRSTDAYGETIKKVTSLRVALADQIDTHNQKTLAGVAVTDDEVEANQRRLAQLRAVTAALDEEGKKQQRVNAIIDQATTELREEAAAHDQANEARKEGTGSTNLFGGSMNSAFNAVSALTGGIIGGGGLIAALAVLADDLRENVQAAREFQEAFLNLQFLSDSFNEQEKKFVGKAAIFGGRSPAETATALAEVKSFFPGKSDKDNQAILLEIAELARTTDAPLSDLTSPFLGLVQSGLSPQEAQNTLRATIVQGGVSDPGKVGGLLGKVLSPGQQIGDLTAAESAGLVAGATGLDRRSPEEQITALNAILRSLLGNQSPEQQEIAQRAGIDTSDFLSALESLGKAVEEGLLSKADLDILVGGEGLNTAAALGDATKRNDLLNKVNAVVQASQSSRDLTADAISNQFKGDRGASLNFALKQAEAAESVADANTTDALESELAVQLLDNELRKDGVGPVRRFIARKIAGGLSAVGFSAETAVGAGDLVTGGELLGSPLYGAEADDRVKAQLEAANDGLIIDSGADFDEQLEAARQRVEERKRAEQEAAQADPANQQGFTDTLPASLGQVAGLEALSPAIYQLVAGLERNSQLLEQQQAEIAGGQGYFGRKAASVINNYNGSVFRGDPLIDDLDGRYR